MGKQEQKEIYEIDNQKFTVVTRTIENAQSMNNLYEAFSKYAIRKLSLKMGWHLKVSTL